jgi:hypothetical protein
MPTILGAFLFAAALLGAADSAFGQLRTETLLDSCKRKTQVWESVQGKPQPVGEKIDGLCHGYLIGVYDASIDTKAVCAPGNPPSPEYLLSVVETYLKTEPAARGKNATQVARAAYLRAFPCKDKTGNAGVR